MITIDLKWLKQKKLTPSEFCVLKCLHDQDYEILKESIDENAIISIDDFETLQTKGYIKITGDKLDFSRMSFRQSARDLFDTGSLNRKFAQLYTMFPMKVPDGRGGYRVLRAKNTDSADAKSAKEKFMKMCKTDPTVADQMIKGLEIQLETQRGSLQYLQQFNVWINQSTWQKYTDLEIDEKEEKNIDRI